MIKKVFQTGVVASLMAAANLAWASGPELRGVRVSATPGGTQVTLDLSAATSQKLFTLNHPERAVIDLGHTRLARSTRLPRGVGVVSGFRIGTQPGRSIAGVAGIAYGSGLIAPGVIGGIAHASSLSVSFGLVVLLVAMMGVGAGVLRPRSQSH